MEGTSASGPTGPTNSAASTPPPGDVPPPPADVPLGDPERRRAFVAALQRDLNRHLVRLGAGRELVVDGEWDEDTDAAFKQVCRILGIAPEPSDRTFRLIAGAAAARTSAERRQARTDGAAFERELRMQFAHARGDGTGRAMVGGTPLSAEERREAYVAALQRDLNRHLRLLSAGEDLAVCGQWNDDTQRAFEQVCRVLGLAPERTVRTFRLIAGAAAKPTRAERARAADAGADFAGRLESANRRKGGAGLRIVVGDPLPREERQQAYVAALQRDLNHYLMKLGSAAVLAVDGRWGENTDLAFRRVCHLLGVKPERDARTYRVISGSIAQRTAEELQRGADHGAAFEQRLRERFARERAAAAAAAPVDPLPPRDKPDHKPVDTGRPDPPAPGGRHAALARAIEAHRGRYANIIIRESRRTGVPVSLLCAVIERESGFSNVFGHDGVQNPIKSPRGSNLQVTEELYRRYLEHRRKGLGQQGVGPMQLTYYVYQDQADKLGGCWRPGPNIRVGAQAIRDNIKSYGGVWRGLKAYNGGPNPVGDAKVAAEGYATAVVAAEKVWRSRLGPAAHAAADGDGTHAPETGPGGAARTLRLTKTPMRGHDVEALQRVLNRRYAAWGIPKRVTVDGSFGPQTRRAAREVAFGLGLAKVDFEGGFTPQVIAVMRRPPLRTPKQRERAQRRTQWRRRLKSTYSAAGPGSPLLRGHKAPAPVELRRIIVLASQKGLVVTSTNDGKHASGSYHYRDRAVDFGLPGPLIGTSKGMAMMVALQRDLARRPQHFAELFGPDVPSMVKNGVKQYPGDEVARTHKDHVHVAI